MLYIYIAVAAVAGLIIGLIIQLPRMAKLKKENKSMQGLLESERLIKETAQKENSFLLQSADAALLTTKDKLRKTEDLVRMMDADILLLQKSNEETEALMEKNEPALYDMKLKLIEANNAIARYKAHFEEKK